MKATTDFGEVVVVVVSTLEELVAIPQLLGGVIGIGNGLGQSISFINSEGTSSTPKVYNANGDPALRATRRPTFDSWVDDGVEVNGQTFKMNQHAENSLFKSGRKDIMPDDIIDALLTKPQPANPGSVMYVNPSTGTKVYVNPTTQEIVGVQPIKFID
ncbi:MAG: hypothetical protein ACOYIF_11800 [Acetivibrionales bacterium]